jgi:MFS family permease
VSTTSLALLTIQIGAFGRDIIGLSYAKSLNLILIINGVGYIGRIAPAILADRYVGAVNAITPCAFFSGILLFAWSGVHNQSGLIGFSVIYGLFSSGVQSMFAVALSSLTTDLSKAGTRMGMCFSIVSISTLIGPPIAGALITQRGGSYLYAQMWGGTVVVTSALVLVAARLSKTGFHLKKRC